jgi:hypothetical protein
MCCTDSNWTFRLFACYNGKVIASLQSSMKDLQKTYVEAIAAIVKDFPVLAEPAPAESLVAVGEGASRGRSLVLSRFEASIICVCSHILACSSVFGVRVGDSGWCENGLCLRES